MYVDVIPHISINVHSLLNGCIAAVLGHQNESEQIDTRSFSNVDILQHPNRAFPDRGSFLSNGQFVVLHTLKLTQETWQIENCAIMSSIGFNFIKIPTWQK